MVGNLSDALLTISKAYFQDSLIYEIIFFPMSWILASSSFIINHSSKRSSLMLLLLSQIHSKYITFFVIYFCCALLQKTLFNIHKTSTVCPRQSKVTNASLAPFLVFIFFIGYVRWNRPWLNLSHTQVNSLILYCLNGLHLFSIFFQTIIILFLGTNNKG